MAILVSSLVPVLSSDLTYEELKLGCSPIDSNRFQSSDLTYEELKLHAEAKGEPYEGKCSDLTYEELKYLLLPLL